MTLLHGARISTLLFIISFALPLIASAGTFPAQINLDELDGKRGFLLTGVAAGDSAGDDVALIGDVNGDGIDDILVGAKNVDVPAGTAGASYVVFGRDAFPASFSLSDLDGTNGFTIRGIESFDAFGDITEYAGDFNSDGHADILIGAPGRSPNGVDGAGEAYLIYGQPSFPAEISIDQIDSINGIVFQGSGVIDQVGNSHMGFAGDVNNDGKDDILITSQDANVDGINNAGETYLIYGNTTSPSPLLLSDLLPENGGTGERGITIQGFEDSAEAGISASGIGDFNNDGIDDIAIGAWRADTIFTGRNDGGEVYVIFGNVNLPTVVDLGTLTQPLGLVIAAVEGGDHTGWSVASAGDFNDDGIDDLIIGAPSKFQVIGGNTISTGGAYIVMGRTNSPNIIDLTNTDPNNGILTILGVAEGDKAGWDVSGHADVNDDGVSDVIIGATQAGPGDFGKAYVLFGRSIVTPSTLSVGALNGANGTTLSGDRDTGWGVSLSGDVNDDGIADMMIGVPNRLGGGGAYILFGR